MKVLLMGNPNVGKSVLFNRLTGTKVLTSNYPGTTIEYTKGFMRVGGERVEVIDVPGTYSLDPTSPAEETAVKMLQNGDVIINVVDSTNLERSLSLTLQLIKYRKPMVVALNIWDETTHSGITIDRDKLEHILGVACLPTTGITGEGIKTLVETLPTARVSDYDYEEGTHWQEVGTIVAQVQTVVHRHHTLLERLGDASVRPMTGIVLGVLVLLILFEIIRLVGEGLISYLFDPLFEGLWAPVMLKLSGALGGSGFVHDILVGKTTHGVIDFGQSFGLLTTGLYVPIAAVLRLCVLHGLSFLEDSGYLPRRPHGFHHAPHGYARDVDHTHVARPGM
jgi:ferrous iron transport protein B